MTTFYLAGQSNFGNRGCEALVRSTVAILREALDEPRFLVPSQDIARDAAQWPEAEANGVTFVPFPKVPYRYITWNRLCSRLDALTWLRWPGLPLRPPLAGHLAACDAVLSIGGDIFSLDYGLDSPFFYLGIAENALKLGKPVLLWGASVGPFAALPGVERQMASHLKRLTLVTVRESHTLAYLAGLGVVGNVLPVCDPAFVMLPECFDIAPFWPAAGRDGVLGLNISPLVEAVRSSGGGQSSLIEETLGFIRGLLRTSEMGVLLVPHVAPLDGGAWNSDEHYLGRLLDALGDTGGRVCRVPPRCNAPQLKYVISRCRFFIGARTHATIAAFSTAVPTISIAYSIKARGINRDLFGHERYVLPTPAVCEKTLSDGLALLQAEEGSIRALLAERIPGCRDRARDGARWLGQWLAQGGRLAKEGIGPC